MELIDIRNTNRYICKVLHTARIITLWRLLCKLSPLNLVKVLFSENNADVFELNGLILGTLIDVYVRVAQCKNYNSDLLFVKYC